MPDSAWYAQETAKARYYGYIETLRAEPDLGATREAVVQMLSLLIDVDEQAHVVSVSEFSDLEGVSAENRQNIIDFAEMGYIKGYPDGTFAPEQTINRAEILTLAEAALGYIVTSQEDLDNIPAGVKKITIIKPGLIIENKTIEADIYIAPGVNESVIIKNSTVKGKIEIAGGTSENPIILENVTANKVVITKAKEKPAVSILSSDITELEIKSETTVKTDEKTTIDAATVLSEAKIEGKGEIKKAYVSAKDVVIEKRPGYVEITEKNIVLKVSGADMIQETDDRHRNTGGSSHGGSSREPLTAVTGILISGTAKVGGSLTAEVTPADATVSYKWQREEAGGTFADIYSVTPDTDVYILTDEDVDKKIRIVAAGTGNYTGTVTSNEIGPVESNDPVAIKIKQGFIPVANSAELKQIGTAADNTFGAGTKYENTYTGGLDKKYIQIADINLAGENFVPVGYDESADTAAPFIGTFLGNDFEISNLTIERDKELQGLFSKLGTDSLISDVTIDGASLKTSSRTGALAGEADDAAIEKSKVTNVSFDFYEAADSAGNSKSYIGGFVGKAAETSFSDLELDGFEMTAENLTNAGVSKERSNIGGITGLLNGGNMTDIQVKNMYVDAAVKWETEFITFFVYKCGGLAGELQNSGTQMLVVDGCSASGLNLILGSQSAVRTGGLIGEVEAANTTGDITIENSTAAGSIQAKIEGMLGATMIGGFIAIANGSNTPRGYVLVENCSASVNINNLGIEVGYVDTATNHGFGGFAARLTNVRAYNCHASGTLDSAFLTGAGGFSGWITDSSLEKCYATGDVLGCMLNGGFACYISGSNLNQCYAAGNVKSSTSDADGTQLFQGGGFAFTIAAGTTVSDCYCSGDVGGADSVYNGGFAYAIGGTVTNVYVSGSITGASDNYTFAYSVGAGASVEKSYWNTSANPSGTALGSGTGDITGITAAAFSKKATFPDWDISDVSEGKDTIWEIQEDATFPYLIEPNWYSN